jgi:hypothetical protein
MESITNLGANIAILTAKHGCGFGLWPTKSKLPDGSPYGYNVGAEGAAIQYDVLREFVNSANAAGVGYGFYYSIMKNFYLCHSFSGTNSCMKEVLFKCRQQCYLINGSFNTVACHLRAGAKWPAQLH